LGKDPPPDRTFGYGDELIVECPVGTADEVCRLTEEVMKEALSDVLGSEVPVEVEAKVCECWKEK